MKKIKLVLQPDQFTSFTSYYLEEYWRQWFDISIYDATKTYDRNDTVFVFWWMNVDDELPHKLKDAGFRVAIDNIWESRTFRNDFHWIEHKYSMRWNESLWWRAEGYAEYFPKSTPDYLCLLPLRMRKPNRDRVVQVLGDLLDRMLWSYMALDRKLPNDTDDTNSSNAYMHPSWYEKTYCSIVVETRQDLPMHVSEKSYKPLAYFHPFLSVSATGTLAFLREAGFETFDNIFDESYDTMSEFEDRLALIKSNIELIDLDHGYDKLTQEKIQHNHDLFFNEELVKKEMYHGLVEPLLEYAET